jgi:plasmid stabilization system protein ParE
LAQVIYSTRALENLERAFEFLASKDAKSGAAAVAAIRGAVEVLAKHPYIGRATSAGLRELVISYGSSGYMALYWFAPGRDEVVVLALRHQRELDYPVE